MARKTGAGLDQLGTSSASESIQFQDRNFNISFRFSNSFPAAEQNDPTIPHRPQLISSLIFSCITGRLRTIKFVWCKPYCCLSLWD